MGKCAVVVIRALDRLLALFRAEFYRLGVVRDSRVIIPFPVVRVSLVVIRHGFGPVSGIFLQASFRVFGTGIKLKGFFAVLKGFFEIA